MRAAGAEVRGAGGDHRQQAAPAFPARRGETEAGGDGLGHVLGAERASGGQQLAAHDGGDALAAVQGLLQVPFQERHLVLDHQHLVQAGGHGGQLAGVDRERHRQPDQAQAQLVAGRLVEAEVGQRPLDDGVRGARGQDTEGGVAGAGHDPVEAVRAGVGAGQVEAAGEQVVLGVQGGGAEQDGGGTPGLLPGDGDAGAQRAEVDGGRGVGDVRDDLQAHPQAGGPRHGHRVQAVLDDLGHR